MKGLKSLSRKTQSVKSTKRGSWIPLYYDIAKDTVYDRPTEDNFFLTYLINPNTEKEIEETVHRMMAM